MDLIGNLFVFVLATFLGLELVRRVSPLLHTPLMSLTNAISAISIVAAILVLGNPHPAYATPLVIILGTLAVFCAMTNVVSGFLITDRMLRMFKTRQPVKAGAPGILPLAVLGLLATGYQGFAPLFGAAAAAPIDKNQLIYLASAALFVLSIKWLNHPTTARKGVIAGEIGMAAAIVAVLLTPNAVLLGDPNATGYIIGNPNMMWIAIGGVVGTIVGIPISMIQMTAVPQRTAFSHMFGGLAVGLVGTCKYFGMMETGKLNTFFMAVISFEVVLGLLTCTGSLIAAGKLSEKMPTRPIVFKGQKYVNYAIIAAMIVLGVVVTIRPDLTALYWVMCALALVFGVSLVIAIGGADMPTVISLLNSYAGLAAAAMGFVLDNKLLILAGALDGSSGLILSIIMCKAMNRSFSNVLFGAFGSSTAALAHAEQRTVRSASPEEAASILDAARRVVVVPGYGMAVAQAQHKVRELYDSLTRRGVDVQFAIHPVAGRMPGHMNVLLAEADVPYDKMVEMEDINSEMSQVDVVLVIGANDVTNPAARNDPQSPIYGMPIIDVDKARSVMVIKRSMSSGFAGIDNDLYYMDKTLMLFGDAKSFVGEIVKEMHAQ